METGGFTVKKLHVVSMVMLAWVSFGGVCTAQTDDGGPDSETAPVRIGPLWMNPRIQLTNLGVDTNVFNTPSGQAQKDATATLSPATDVWLRVGPSWLQFTVREDLVWFQKYADERSANTSDAVKWKVTLNRLNVTAKETYLRTRDRPGFEIDLRALRSEYGSQLAIDYRGLAQTFFGVTGAYQKVDYDKDDVFLGENLHDELNHTTMTAGVYVRQQLTPLTQVSATVDQEQDRFEFSSLRDSNSTNVAFNVTFDPHALIRGTATVGYQHFHPLVAGLPDYVGATALGDLTYTLMGVTRFQAQFKRAIGYSYDITQPYYLESGIIGSVAQQVYGPVDVIARGGYSLLAYRDRGGVIISAPDRSDYVHSYGGGVGYHIGKDLRIGFDVDQQHRLSAVVDRRYDDLKYGTSISYAF